MKKCSPWNQHHANKQLPYFDPSKSICWTNDNNWWIHTTNSQRQSKKSEDVVDICWQPRHWNNERSRVQTPAPYTGCSVSNNASFYIEERFKIKVSKWDTQNNESHIWLCIYKQPFNISKDHYNENGKYVFLDLP